MKLYKFRSLDNFEFVADILINKKLYAANFLEMNDPMEGIFFHDSSIEKQYIDAVKEEKHKLRICSLSHDFSNPILWAHYANGFKGICIEIDIDESRHDIQEIRYRPLSLLLSNENNSHVNTIDYSPAEAAKAILKRKFQEWTYEGEYRVFSNNKYIDAHFDVTAIYLGTRISDIDKAILEKIVSDDIPMISTYLDHANQVLAEKEKDDTDEL